jgi:two-component system, chemotaxis family, protein-glutamate methylesterase/glutaminase
MSAQIAVQTKLKVLVVDDMLTYRTILSRVLGEFPEVEVVGTASNGKIALQQMEKNAADLILMDLEMPVMTGLEALPELRRLYPKSQVVLISGTNRSSADLTLQALQLGAMDFIAKPGEESFAANLDRLREHLSGVISACFATRKDKPVLPISLVRTEPKPDAKSATATLLKTEGQFQPKTALSADKPAAPQVAAPRSRKGSFKVLAIGVSTGGPNALAEFLPMLPGNLGVPVVLVQHMPPLFTASLANMLDQKCALRVKEAEDNEALEPNTVYIAPGGRHLSIKHRLGAAPLTVLSDTPPVNSCRPAVDVLFDSLPGIYGEHILSVILTGMGNDGTNGVRNIKAKGGYSLTQSEQSCVVYGMPRSVDEHGLSDEKVDLKSMALRVQQLLSAR